VNKAVRRSFSTTEAQRARGGSGGSVVYLLVCILVTCGLSGCGYVVVKVTAPPPTCTATASVRLISPTPRATVTAAPATPLPTATATATPTPVIHIVEKGDTILEIAFRYDVSAQALIEVNEILNPRALRIGQPLIIPLDEEALLKTQATATPTPMPLQIVNMAFHYTPVGSLWCMGEVENERDEDLELVQLQVSLHNADGAMVDVATSFVATEVVPGHGTAPFAVLLPHPPPGGFASYQIVVLSAEPLTHWGRRHQALFVESVTGEVEGDTFAVKGVVHNRGQGGAEGVEAIVTAYGQDGTVVGVRRVEVAASLAAGESQDFALSLIPAAPAVRVRAVACGMNEVP
jgi:LysM repeat protein